MTDKLFEFIRVKERLEQGEINPPEPIVSGLLFRQSLAIIGAPEDSFKTHFTLQLAIALSLGTQCYSNSCAKSHIAYLALEGGEDYILERLEDKISAMEVNRDEVMSRMYIKDCSQIRLDDSATIEKLKSSLTCPP